MATPIDQILKSFVPEGTTLRTQLREWFRQNGYWYATSAVAHAIGFVILAIIVTFLPAMLASAFGTGKAPTFDAADVINMSDAIPEQFDMGSVPIETAPLDPNNMFPGLAEAQEAKFFTTDQDFSPEGGGKTMDLDGQVLGGLNGFTLPNVGVGGLGGVGVSEGTGEGPGVGGEGTGFGHRTGSRDKLGGRGITKVGERAVLGGLHWLAKHQMTTGNWSLQHSRACSGHGCGGQGSVKSDSAATAMALLPFLGAGQSHKTKCPYQRTVGKGVAWLIKHQANDGDLSAGSPQRMYAHGLATIALCEAYGMSKDPVVGEAASKAVRFIERAQNERTGGWRYEPGDEGDTSVTGWQVMALKSAQMAGLGVNSLSLENTRKWLATVAAGEHNGLFMYQPYKEVTPSMTAVGLLCNEYLGMSRDDPALKESVQHLLANLPDATLSRDIYYWYYATMAMGNIVGPDWDTWNRQMRRTLVTTQINQPEGCANGSWDPDKPTNDRWGSQGGRLMVTSLSVLTLEVYYRYLPLYKINMPGKAPAKPSPAKKTEAPKKAPAAEAEGS